LEWKDVYGAPWNIAKALYRFGEGFIDTQADMYVQNPELIGAIGNPMDERSYLLPVTGPAVGALKPVGESFGSRAAEHYLGSAESWRRDDAAGFILEEFQQVLRWGPMAQGTEHWLTTGNSDQFYDEAVGYGVSSYLMSKYYGRSPGRIAIEEYEPAQLKMAARTYASGEAQGALDTIAEGRRLTTYFPPNRGFAGMSIKQTLQPGTMIDRFGTDAGRFVSPTGTPIPMRSLPYGAAEGPYGAFRVVKPIEVQGGSTAPWFGQLGGGMQYELPQSIQSLLRSGYLERVGP
jgi:hypothetical protein